MQPLFVPWQRATLCILKEAGKSLHSGRGVPGVKASRPFATTLQKRLPGLMSSTVMRVPVAVPLTGEPRELPSGSKAKMVKVPL